MYKPQHKKRIKSASLVTIPVLLSAVHAQNASLLEPEIRAHAFEWALCRVPDLHRLYSPFAIPLNRFLYDLHQPPHRKQNFVTLRN